MRIRKILAFFLSMSLIVCSVPTLVFADETEAADDGTNESKVEEVVETGTEEVVVDGEPAQNGQGGEDGNGDSGDAPVIVTTTDAPVITGSPVDPSIVYFGTCGDVSWRLSNYCLFFYDNGSIKDYDQGDEVPWYKYRLLIKKVSFDTGSVITHIGNNAFRDCSNLSSITIPNSVSTIGISAFEGCSSLTSISIPNSVTTIGYSAFEECSSLTSISIPNSVTTIGSSAFVGCSSLTSITIPNSVTTIGKFAFEECSSLTSITIPNSVTTIGNYAFVGCSSLTSITIPNSVTTIGNNAFEDCSSLTSITIPNSVSTIGNYAFKGCSSLTSITIPNSVTTIGKFVFQGCSSLTSITIPNSVTTIGKCAFDGCTGLTSITIPDSVTTIGEKAFYNCKGLVSVIMSKNVSDIGKYAFANCINLTSITIPYGVHGCEKLFDRCNNLMDIYCYADPVNLDNNLFYRTNSNLVVHVKSKFLGLFTAKYGEGIKFVDDMSYVDVLGNTVSLGDQIGINYFLDVSKDISISQLSVDFTWGTGSYAKTAIGSFVQTSENGANYIVSCAIAARCMTDTVTMTVKECDNVYATSTFKVVDYAAKVAKSYPADNTSGSNYKNLTYNQKLHTLLLAMLDYGAESQKYFKYRTDDLASSYKGDLVDAGSVRSTVNSAYTNYDAATLSSFASKNTITNIGDDKIGISYAGAAVACTSKTSFKFYFNKADGYDINSLSATYKGKALTFKEEGDSVTLEIAGLSPKEYAPTGTDLYDCSISLTINGKVYTYTYLDYVYKCNNLNHAFKNTAVALAAYSYFAANLEG